MEWLHQNWQLVSLVLAHVGYLIQSEMKRAMNIDRMERHLESTDKRLGHLEVVVENSSAATCKVHSSEIIQIHRRLDKLEAGK